MGFLNLESLASIGSSDIPQAKNLESPDLNLGLFCSPARRLEVMGEHYLMHLQTL